MRRRIRVRRVIGAVVSIVGGAAMLALTFYVGVQTGSFQERRAEMQPRLRISAWTGGTSRWAALARLEPWGVKAVVHGDAFGIYWPDGNTETETACARSIPSGFDGPAWTIQETSTRAAAGCDRVDAIVQAAHIDDIDFTTWLHNASEAGYGIDDQRAYAVYQRPYREISAVLARAHWRIEDGDLDGAESDARAVVSSSLHMIRKVPEASAVAFGFALATGALDHLREINERRNDAATVSAISDVQLQLASLRSTFTGFMHATGELATLPEAGERFVEFASSDDYPLGMRTHAVSILGYAWVKHPREIVFGPSDSRREAVEAINARPDLVLAVKQARMGLDMPVKDRIRFAKMFL